METLEQRQMLSAVTGAYLFYNNSAFDGNNSAINAGDDAAIATDKNPLRELGRSTFANYSSYSHGLNGLMIDIDRPNGTPKLSDFVFRTGNDTNDPFQWSVAPTPTSFAVRKGAGQNGADRFEFTWDDNSAVKGKWVQVTVLANANTGLFARDTFYFGSAAGETGNKAGMTRVDATDQQLIRNNAATTAGIANSYDINRDGRVDAADQMAARGAVTNFQTDLKLIAAPLNATSDLQTEVFSFSEVRLTWLEHSTKEAGYSILYSFDPNGTFSELARTDTNATAHVLSGLSAGMTYYFRVVPLAPVGSGTVAPMSSTVPASTFERFTSGTTTQDWYSVSLSWTSVKKGEAGFTATGSVNVYAAKVQADSAKAAIFAAVRGKIDMTNFSNDTFKYNFESNSAFKVEPMSTLASIQGFDRSTLEAQAGHSIPNDQMLIVMEDEIHWGNADNDWDDFFWEATATVTKPEQIIIGFYGADVASGWPNGGNVSILAVKDDLIAAGKDVRMFDSTDWGTAYSGLIDALDTNDDGQYDPTGYWTDGATRHDGIYEDSNGNFHGPDLPRSIRIFGYSWGGLSATNLQDKIDSDNDFMYNRAIDVLVLIDPASDWRPGGLAPISAGVKTFHNWYETIDQGFLGGVVITGEPTGDAGDELLNTSLPHRDDGFYHIGIAEYVYQHRNLVNVLKAE